MKERLLKTKNQIIFFQNLICSKNKLFLGSFLQPLEQNIFFFICSISFLPFLDCPFGWNCRIHRLLLCWEVRHPPNECLLYDIKQSDGEAPVMLSFGGMQSNPLLLSLPGPLWPGMKAPDRVLSMGQIDLNSVLMLNWFLWNRIVLTLNWTILTFNWL